MKKSYLFTLSFGLLLLTGCTNDTDSDLIDNSTTTEPVTYTNAVKSIITNNCISCHGTIPTNGAPMSLTTYADVKNAVLNRGLIDRISRSQGADGMMPLGGTRLPQSTINKIIEWNTNGLVE